GFADVLFMGADAATLHQALHRVLRTAERDLTMGAHEAAGRREEAMPVAYLSHLALLHVTIEELMDATVSLLREQAGVPYVLIVSGPVHEGSVRLRASVGWPTGADERPRRLALPDALTLTADAGVHVHRLEPAVADESASFFEQHRICTVVSVPIEHDAHTYGWVLLCDTVPRTLGSTSQRLYRSVANVLAASLKRNETEQALRESHARTRAILDTTVEGIITIDERGRIESFNQAAERIFGYTAGEVKGLNVSILMPEPYRSSHDGYIHNYLQTGHKRIIGIGREVQGLRRDGSTFPLDLSVSEVHLQGRRIFTGIVRDITERRRLEQEILRTSDRERRRIGQDLHDGLGQMLTGTGLITQSLARRIRENDPDLATELDEITGLIREADQYARALTRGLTPVEFDASALHPALHRLTKNAERLFSIACSYEGDPDVMILDNSAATHLYRITQEAVSNAVKHGKAHRVDIRFAPDDYEVVLEVADDGIGFPDTLDDTERGMGVHIMGHRARLVGGELSISRLSGGGTCVRCSLPTTLSHVHVRPSTSTTSLSDDYGTPYSG
ncbi:MAG: PAS domain S-box protein, partial [Bacteroidota bacterium]